MEENFEPEFYSWENKGHLYQKSRLLQSLYQIIGYNFFSALKAEMKSYKHMKHDGGQFRQRINRYISEGRLLSK